MDFSEKVAVVTGGASGIGLGMVRSFARRGANIVIADLDEKAIARVVDELRETGVKVVGQVCDVSKIDDLQSLAEATVDHFSKVNILCNNAGVGLPTRVTRMKLEDWQWIINVDLWGPINGLSVFLPLIEQAGEGHVNSTASLAGLIAPEFMGAYAAAKHAVVGLMAATERELRAKDSKVHASVLCPGSINTNISFNSVANRPGKTQQATRDATGQGTGQSIQASLAQGLDPNDVGELVAESIVQNKFWIMTHPELSTEVRKQLDAMVTDQTLTEAKLLT